MHTSLPHNKKPVDSNEVLQQPRKQGDILKEGWMYKQGHVVKNWKRRYFILRSQTIWYFGKPHEKHEKGTIQLSGAEVRDDVDELMIVIKTISGKEFLLKLDTYADKMSWKACMLSAISNPAHGRRLLMAAEIGDSLTIADILTEQPEDVIAIDKETNRTALHLASLNGNAQIVKLLIQVGKRYALDINYTDNCGWTALSLAVRHKKYDVVSVLLESGAKIEKGTLYGNALMIAVDTCDIKLVELIVKNGGANVNTDGRKGRSAPLQLAAENGSLDVIAYLVACGANVNETDRSGRTALYMACANAAEKDEESVIETVGRLLLLGGNPLICTIEGNNCFTVANTKVREFMEDYHNKYGVTPALEGREFALKVISKSNSSVPVISKGE